MTADPGFDPLLLAARREPASLMQLLREMDRAGRNYLPLLVWSWWRSGRIDVEQLRDLLLEAWTMAEFPTRQLSLRSWMTLFSATGFVSDAPSLVAPTGPLRLYRGCLPSSQAGMSWTTDRACAEWFALRIRQGGQPAAVYQVDAEPRIVLARVTARSEEEVIVRPGLKRAGYRAVPTLCPSEPAPPAAVGS